VGDEVGRGAADAVAAVAAPAGGEDGHHARPRRRPRHLLLLLGQPVDTHTFA